VIGVVIFEAR